MAAWLIMAGTSFGDIAEPAGATGYVSAFGYGTAVGTETWMDCLARGSYIWANLYVRVISNGVLAASTLRSRKNAVNGNQSVSIPASTTGVFRDTTNTDSLASGDLFNFQVVTGAGGTDLLCNIVTSTLKTVGDSNIPILCTVGDRTLASAIVFLSLGGSALATATEARTQYIVRVAATLSSLRFRISENTRDGASTGRTRINGVNGAQSVSIPASTAGNFEDIVNTDAVAVGNSVNYQLVPGGASGTITARVIQVKSTSVGRQVIASYVDVGTVAFGTTAYYPAEGLGQDPTATEANVQGLAQVNFATKNLFVRSPTNSVNGASTIRTRRNTGNGNLSVSIPASTTGTFEDTTRGDEFYPGDLINYQIVTGGAAGSIVITQIGFELAQLAAPTLRQQARVAVGAGVI